MRYQYNKELIIDYLDKNISIQKISEILDIKYSALKNYIAKNNLRSKFSKLNDDDKNILNKNDLRRFREQGMSCKQIAKKLGYSKSTIHRYLNKYNLIEGYDIKLVRDKYKDLSNKIIGYFTVIKLAYVKNHHTYWLCKCKCGNEKIVKRSSLFRSKNPSCGCYLPLKNKGKIKGREKENAFLHIGEKINRLTIVDVIQDNVGDPYKIVCRCDCGGTIKATYWCLKNNKVQSCGCYQREVASNLGIKNNGFKNRFNYHWYFIVNDVKQSCRSSYEVFYANYLIENKIDFEYEKHILKINNNRKYKPDFYLIDKEIYIETKGAFDVDDKSMRQKENIDILINDYDIRIKYWQDIVSDCHLPYKALDTYKRHATLLGLKIEDYLAYNLYKERDAA